MLAQAEIVADEPHASVIDGIGAALGMLHALTTYRRTHSHRIAVSLVKVSASTVGCTGFEVVVERNSPGHVPAAWHTDIELVVSCLGVCSSLAMATARCVDHTVADPNLTSSM